MHRIKKSHYCTQYAEIALEEVQFRSHLDQVKYFSNDLKSLGHSYFVPNFSKIIVTGNSKIFRVAYAFRIVVLTYLNLKSINKKIVPSFAKCPSISEIVSSCKLGIDGCHNWATADLTFRWVVTVSLGGRVDFHEAKNRRYLLT